MEQPASGGKECGEQAKATHQERISKSSKNYYGMERIKTVDELNAKELDNLARLAHDLGADAADQQEHTQGEIEQLAEETLARILASLETEAGRRLFTTNFYRGWRFVQTDSAEWEGRIVDPTGA